MSVDILQACGELLPYAVGIRRTLHRNPELSGEEAATLALIRKALDQAQIEYEEVPDGGILAFIGRAESGASVLLRADCDALPMEESSRNALMEKAVTSECPGKAHTCGHDAHTAMLLAAGRLLKARETELDGRVILLFERAEETGVCIGNVIEYIQRRELHIDSCMAVHVTADLSVGEVGIPEGITNAGSFRFDVQLKGRGGHGSTPSKVNNPIDCFLSIAQAANGLRMRYVSPFDPATLHICAVNAGCAFNVTPETLTFAGSLRYFTPEAGQALSSRLRAVIEHNAAAYENEVIFQVFEEMYKPSVNAPEKARAFRAYVAAGLGEKSIIPRKPAMGSESFGALAQLYPSVKCNVGIRNEEKGIIYPTHSPYFDIDEAGMKYGIYLYAAYAVAYLNQDLCLEKGK